MGGGSYSHQDRDDRSRSMGYHSKPAHEIFKEKRINKDMSPMKLGMRESRYSEEHPNVMSIIIALDETASMGFIPHELVKDGLPKIMSRLLEQGIKDPQVCFLGIGDHITDNYPLQVGQFESSDELLDKWLTSVNLEEGGGGNGGESYLLAWYFAAIHTSLDSFEKDSKKGILITIGDEPTHKDINSYHIKDLTGNGDTKGFTAGELLSMASETYEVYHVHVRATYNGKQQHVVDDWKELLGNNLIIAEDSADVVRKIADCICKYKDSFIEDAIVVKDENYIGGFDPIEDDKKEDNFIL